MTQQDNMVGERPSWDGPTAGLPNVAPLLTRLARMRTAQVEQMTATHDIVEAARAQYPHLPPKLAVVLYLGDS